jgi:hypothetical protein
MSQLDTRSRIAARSFPQGAVSCRMYPSETAEGKQERLRMGRLCQRAAGIMTKIVLLAPKDYRLRDRGRAWEKSLSKGESAGQQTA